MDCTLPCSSVPGILHSSRQEYWSGLPFPSQGSCWPRDWTRISCIAGRYFTDSARPEAWQGTCDHACPEQKATKKRKWKVMVKEQLMISKASPMSTSPAMGTTTQEKLCPSSDQQHPSPESIKLFSFLYCLFHAKAGPSITFSLDSRTKILNSVPCLPPLLSWFPKSTLWNRVLILPSLS